MAISNIKSINNPNFLLMQNKYLTTIFGGRNDGAVAVTKKAYARTTDAVVFLGLLLSCACVFYCKRGSSIKIASSLCAASNGVSYCLYE